MPLDGHSRRPMERWRGAALLGVGQLEVLGGHSVMEHALGAMQEVRGGPHLHPRQVPDGARDIRAALARQVEQLRDQAAVGVYEVVLVR